MLNATFRQLQAFVLAAEGGTFAAAAERLGISPAAVSDHIRNLERKIGAPLFDRRSGAAPKLSEKGQALLKKAPSLLAQAQEVAELAEAAPPLLRKAKVGAGEYILEHVLYPNLPKFQLDHPDIQIEISRVTPNVDGARATQDGRCDLVYLTLQADMEPPQGEFLGHVRTGLFASPNHPIAKSWAGPGSQKLPMILPLSGSGPERFRMAALARAGVTDLEVVTRAEHSQTQLALAIAGLGACSLFYELAQDALDAGQLVDLGLDLPLLSRWAIRRPNAFEIEHVRLVDQFITSLLRR
jgi:DNA-binding transcriptional LysR family regulator